jgi:hypothetical protein
MIAVDKVSEPSKSWKFSYSFPTIDFKFQNTGNATAFLWQFGIDVMSAEVDATPVLEFSYKVDNGDLLIFASNRGWGPALDCAVNVNESIIEHTFPAHDLQSVATITDSERGNTQVLRLKGRHISNESLAKAKQSIGAQTSRVHRVFDYGDRYLERALFEFWRVSPGSTVVTDLKEGIPIGTLCIRWACKDTKGQSHEGNDLVDAPGDGMLILTRTGFAFIPTPPPCGAAAPHGPTFVAMIDPDRGPHERVYPMARQIPPGDVERFHIMVAAGKSCTLTMRFTFFVDKHSIVRSERFVVKVWNPRGTYWGHEYRDGAELEHDAAKMLAIQENFPIW